MAGKGILQIKVLGDVSQLSKSLGKGESALMKFAKVAGGAFALYKVVDFFRDSIMAASDLAESLDKSARVFGMSASAVEAWGKTAAKNMGLSRQAAIEAAASYGNLLSGAGIAQDAASGMSMEMVQLAADLAAFNNVPVEDALTAIRSGLVGEMEPMRRSGVILDIATLKQRAMTMGLYDGKGQLDQNVKMLAAYAEMLAQTETEQGNFIDTADGLAGQQKTLNAMWEDAKATLGEALMPIMTKFLNWVTSHMPQITAAFQMFADVLAKIWSVGEKVWGVLSKVADVLSFGGGFSPTGEAKFGEMLREMELFESKVAMLKGYSPVYGPGGTAPPPGQAGLSHISQSGLYELHQGESVATREDTSAMREMVYELRGLRRDVKRSRATFTRPTALGAAGVL